VRCFIDQVGHNDAAAEHMPFSVKIDDVKEPAVDKKQMYH